MKNRKGIAVLAVVLILAILVYANRGSMHFDWASFWLQLRHIAWVHIAAGIAFIYFTYYLRALRWAVFVSRCSWGSEKRARMTTSASSISRKPWPPPRPDQRRAGCRGTTRSAWFKERCNSRHTSASA